MHIFGFVVIMPNAVLLALGAIVMIACFGLQMFIHETGHWLAARFFGFQTPVFGIGYGPRKWSLILGRFCKTEFRLAPIPLGAFVSIPELQDMATAKRLLKKRGIDTEPRFFPIWKRMIVSLAGITANLISVPIMIFLLLSLMGEPATKIESTTISAFAGTSSVAESAGFQTGDVFVSAAGQPVVSPDDLHRALISSKGQPVLIVVKRGNENVAIKVTPSQDGRVGATFTANGSRFYVPVPLTKAARDAVRVTGIMLDTTLECGGVMLHVLPKPPDVPASALAVSGVVSIVQTGALVFRQGIFNFVWYQALIAFNLIIINLIPLPMLDGGNICFFLWEKGSGKAVDARLKNNLFKVSLGLFAAVFLLGLFNDIKHLIMGS